MADSLRKRPPKNNAGSMKLHIVTIGEPKLAYAREGWAEYTKRLGHFHQLRISHLSDKQNTASNILTTAGQATLVAMIIDGPQLSSPQLAEYLQQRALDGKELCFVVGGPDGLPGEVIEAAHKILSLSELTFPHDLAMVVLAEALYRASTINAGHPYHRA